MRTWRKHQARHVGAALAELVDDAFEIVWTANHGNSAYGLAAVGQGRRQNADGLDLRHRPALNRTQQNINISSATEDEHRRRIAGLGVLKRAGIAEIAVGDARS